MKKTGIIIEYNPMHLGHKHHIQETKKITNSDLLIGVMSPNFVQRGQPAIVSKFKRTQAALENGVDIVVELPTFYALQSASHFGSKAIQILDMMQVDSIVFGSETNDIQTLQEYATLPINIDKVKERLQLGYSYPAALSLDDYQLYPNDILGVSYIRAAQNTQIKIYTIKRTNSYFENKDSSFYSAYDIRNNLDKPEFVSQSLTDLSETVNMDLMFDLLRYKLISSSSTELSQIFLVNEGIQNLLKEKIVEAKDYNHFLSLCTSKRYSTSRISRICMHILLNTKEVDIKDYKVRVLGITQSALSSLKGLPVGTKVSDFDPNQIQAEIKATEIYSLFSPEKNLLQQEISKIIIHPSSPYSL